ncbi:histidine phosphatase family protein [Orbaceae bacterium ESL0727]|nr:histidine phosphatase family protein [Orbaceae bacterium ESL0727]
MKKKLLASVVFFCTSMALAACAHKTAPVATAPIVKDDTVTVYVARHGKTLMNTYDRVQGGIDSHLTAEGRQTVKYLGEGLKDIHFDEFYTSDLGRQRETMQIIKQQIGQANAPVVEDTRLEEVFLGKFEGGYDHEMMAAGAKQLKLKGGAEQFKRMRGDGSMDLSTYLDTLAAADPSKTAENYEQLTSRVRAALDDIVKHAQAKGDKTVLIVTSGTALQAIMSKLTDDPRRNQPPVNAAVSKIVYKDGKYTVEEVATDKYIKLGTSRLGGTQQ